MNTGKVHKPHGHLAYGKIGKGFYGEVLSEECESFIAPVKPRILELVERERLGIEQTMFSVGDYGCADASTSVHLIRAFLDLIRQKKGKSFPVTVIYEDQVSNDFNSVFNRLHGVIGHPRSYLPDYKNVYTSATGSSFYDQCVPDNSLDVIMSFLAPHWLPTRPTVYQNTIYRFYNASEEEKAAVAENGKKAWERFLLHRAKELKPGGLLFVSTPCEDPDHTPDQAYIGNQDMFHSMISIWKRYQIEGKITEQEFVEANLNYCQRTKTEFSAPFVDESSPVRNAGLKLLGVDVYHVESIFKTRWRGTKDTAEDRMTHAQDYVIANRPWSNSTFRTALSSSRSEQEKDDIVDAFYVDLYTDLGQRSPADLKTDMVVGYVFVQKEF